MSWRPPFNQGIASFRASRLDDALRHLTQAAEQPGGDKQYIIYDSRAAVYEKLQRRKDALLDAKTVITLAPDQWHGYARAARLFLLARKFDASLKMANMALDRIKLDNIKRRVEMEQICLDVLQAQKLNEERKQAMQNQIVKLPVELLGEVFHYLIAWDSAALIVVLHICTHWRNITQRTPSLWETLILSKRAPIQKLRFWLKHSKGMIRNLHVQIHVTSHLDWPFKELESIPWHNLRTCNVVSWDVAGYLEKLKPHHRTPFAELEEFTATDLHSPPTLLYPLLQASRLRSLEFRASNHSWKSISTHFQNLATLRVYGDGSDFEYVLQTLEANPSLTTLAVTAFVTHRWSVTSAILLSNLTHLEMRGSWASNLLEIIALPSLQILHIIGGGPSLDRALTDATPRMTHLKELILDHCSVTPRIIVELIQQTLGLTRLELMGLSRGVNQVVEALGASSLTSQPKSGAEFPMCPALTHLNLSFSTDVTTGPLVRLIKSRLGHSLENNSDTQPSSLVGSKILSLTIDACEKIDPEWVSWFRANVPSVSCVYQTRKKAGWKR